MRLKTLMKPLQHLWRAWETWPHAYSAPPIELARVPAAPASKLSANRDPSSAAPQRCPCAVSQVDSRSALRAALCWRAATEALGAVAFLVPADQLWHLTVEPMACHAFAPVRSVMLNALFSLASASQASLGPWLCRADKNRIYCHAIRRSILAEVDLAGTAGGTGAADGAVPSAGATANSTQCHAARSQMDQRHVLCKDHGAGAAVERFSPLEEEEAMVHASTPAASLELACRIWLCGVRAVSRMHASCEEGSGDGNAHCTNHGTTAAEDEGRAVRRAKHAPSTRGAHLQTLASRAPTCSDAILIGRQQALADLLTCGILQSSAQVHASICRTLLGSKFEYTWHALLRCPCGHALQRHTASARSRVLSPDLRHSRVHAVLCPSAITRSVAAPYARNGANRSQSHAEIAIALGPIQQC